MENNKSLAFDMYKKRRVISTDIIIDKTTQAIQMKDNYTFGPAECFNFITSNITAPINVFRIVFENCKKALYVIKFNEYSLYILWEKMTQEKLYNEFVKQGIRFNQNIPVLKVKRTLWEHFSPLLENPEYIIKQSGLAGWYDGKFECAETMEVFRELLPELPVHEKSLKVHRHEIGQLQYYSQLLKSVSDLQLRVILFLLPFSGILSSLMLEILNVEAPFVYNFVFLSEFQISTISKFVQVFNRKELSGWSADLTDKQLETLIRTSRDETLIFSAVTDDTFSDYRKRKIRNTVLRIVQRFKRISGVNIGNSHFYALPVIVSNEQYLKKNIKNVFVDQDVLEEVETFVSDPVENALSIFVSYVERHMDEIRKILQKDFDMKDAPKGYFDAVFGVLHEVLTSLDVGNIYDFLGLSNDFDFSFLWQQDDTEEMDESTLKKVMRKEIHNYVSEEKSYPYEGIEGDCVIFDDEFMWVSTDVFNEMLAANALSSEKQQLLLQAKENGSLKLDGYGGFTVRLQRNGRRQEYYKFVRSALNDVGMVEIISLSKEVKERDY